MFYSTSTENMLAMEFFSWVMSPWPATIPIFYAFGPRLNVIEDPWYKQSEKNVAPSPIRPPSCILQNGCPETVWRLYTRVVHFCEGKFFCEISFRHFNFCVPNSFKTSEEKFHAYTTSFDTAASILKFRKSNALIFM